MSLLLTVAVCISSFNIPCVVSVRAMKRAILPGSNVNPYFIFVLTWLSVFGYFTGSAMVMLCYGLVNVYVKCASNGACVRLFSREKLLYMHEHMSLYFTIALILSLVQLCSILLIAFAVPSQLINAPSHGTPQVPVGIPVAGHTELADVDRAPLDAFSIGFVEGFEARQRV